MLTSASTLEKTYENVSNIFRVHFVRGNTSEFNKPVKAVLSLGTYTDPRKVAKGLMAWLEKEPNRSFIVSSDSGHVSVFKASQIEYFDVKPYGKAGKDEKSLDLTAKEKSRLMQCINSLD